VSTDFSQAEWLARRLIEVAPMAVAPTLSHRYYPAFVDYPGGQSLFRETFTVMCTEVINGILRAGGRALVILNVGISAIGPLRAAIGPSRRPSPVKLAYVYEGANDRAPTAPLEEQARGSHADELETSAMLAITAKSVRLSLAQTYTREIMPGPAQPHQS
jgi:creatinine amidohydrolase/Fe(II)-dependent formamide hydrolase-like protein